MHGGNANSLGDDQDMDGISGIGIGGLGGIGG